MAPRSRFALLAAALVTLNVAGLLWIRHELLGRGRPSLRILSVLPEANVDQADRFSLLFDEPIGGKGKAGAPEAAPPFAIQPQPKGHWTWSEPNRLDFALDEPLPAGRVFTIKPAANFETQTGRVLVGKKEFRFETRPLRVDGCQVHSADREQVTVELTFNQPVTPADLLHNLELVDPATGQPLRATCLSGKPDARLVIRCDRPSRDKVLVNLKGELAGAGGELSLGEPVSSTLELPTVFCLLRADVQDLDLEAESVVRLEFSQNLDRKRPVPAVELTPAVKGLQVRLGSDCLVLEGPFEPGRKYTAAVEPGLKSSSGESLPSRQSITFEVPDRSPGLAFPLRRGTLMPGGRLQVDLKVTNLPGLKLTAHRVYANNLVAHVQGSGLEDTSRQLWEKTIPLTLPRNAITTLALDLRELLGDAGPGIYAIGAENTQCTWQDDHAIATVSDLAITAKKERTGYLVWVTSIGSAKPLEGCQVTAMTRTNQVLATGLTDAQGLVRLTIPENHPDGAAWLITAQAGNDLNYLVPEDNAWVLDRVDHSGKPYPRTYDLMLYTERGIYRPGDTIHVTGLIRDAAGQVPPAFPLAVTLERPDGKKVHEQIVTPNPDQQGFFHADFATQADGQLGRYAILGALPGAKETLGETSALVEEYVPVRMDVTAKPTQPRFGPDQIPSVQVDARYLFGQPASQLPLKVAAVYKRVSFESKRFDQYTFTDPDEGDEIEPEDAVTALDDAGQATVRVPLAPATRPDAPANNAGAATTAAAPATQRSTLPACWQARVTATVSEPGGRSVSARTHLVVDTAARHIGMLVEGRRILPADQPIRINWVQVTGDDELAQPTGMSWTLSRVEYDTTLESVGHRFVWKSEERLTPVSKGQIVADGGQAKGDFEITCGTAGLYRLEATDSQCGARTRLEFQAAAGTSQDESVSMDEPERLDIVLDQEKYAPGSQARVLVKSPFAGTLLLTLESDRVVGRQVVEMQANTATVDLPIPEDLRGGAFLAASVVRRVDPSKDKWLPHRAAGLARVVVDHKAAALSITVDAPPKARPGERIRVLVRTTPLPDPAKPTLVHVWAVDEGILKTIAFRTPDPLQHFLAPHEAAVTSADIFGLLLPDYQRPASMVRIGGDEGGGRNLRHSLVPARHREAAVIWRTAVPVSEDGSVVIDADLPDLTGEIRFMAVAANQDRYGSAQQAVTVTAPLLIETSWPRFAAPGDRFDVPAKIFNTTGQPLEVTLAATRVEGPLDVRLPVESKVTVSPEQPATVWLRATATGMGQASVQLQASAMLEGDPLTATATADLPIRPAAPLHRQVELLRAKAGEPLKIAPADVFLPGTVSATVSISGRPSVQMQPAMERLVEYPYGCAEQTTSRLVALLYAPDLLARDCPQDARAAQIGNMIDAGIARLRSMQTVSGGLGYWPGDQYANLWASTYAASFLLRARQAGYRVDPQFSDPLVAYLASQMHQVDEQVDPNVRAQLCSVLAGFGKAPQGWMDRLAERTDQLDIAGRADLAAAFLAIGQKERAATILQDDTLRLTIATTSSGRLTSQVQQEAVLLHVLLDLDPGHAWIAQLVEHLLAARTDGRWASTLEDASALSALARYQLLNKDTADFTGSITCQGKPLLSFASGAPAGIKVKQVDGPLEIASSGTGDLYVSVLFEGLARQDQAKDHDNQLMVRRQWMDREGKPVDPAAVKVGDLVRVQIELTAPGLSDHEQVENLAIVDALPAGMEIENPRLTTAADATGGANQDTPDRVEFRDDRVLLFTAAGRHPRVFCYSLRAITAGQFAVPAVEASCMYDPRFESLNGGGKLEVHK